jgi:response regulator RpfG family c-di-GMP phosphodiesterase
MEEHVKHNVLLVDDRPENLLALEASLEDAQCTIFKAKSGKEALWLVLHHQIDLVLLDVQMPEMDGFEVAKMIHSKKKTKEIQIIFITAISKEQKYVEKGYEVGAVNYLFKPIDLDELKNKVNAALRWSTYQKKMRAVEARKSSDAKS